MRLNKNHQSLAFEVAFPMEPMAYRPIVQSSGIEQGLDLSCCALLFEIDLLFMLGLANIWIEKGYNMRQCTHVYVFDLHIIHMYIYIHTYIYEKHHCFKAPIKDFCIHTCCSLVTWFHNVFCFNTWQHVVAIPRSGRKAVGFQFILL